MEKYDVGVLLGRGGFASVYRALDRATGRSVAIKMIAKRDGPGAARLRREVVVHSSLERHDHVVELYEYFETCGAAAAAAGAAVAEGDGAVVYACLVMELCRGGDLRTAVARRTTARGGGGARPVGEREAARLVAALVEGVAHLHSKAVVHRDLKLANLLLGGPHGDVLKICDFGVAAPVGPPTTIITEEDQERWTLCGTPNYIAPEVVAGAAPHGRPADLWSIGCVAFALLTGRRAPQAARAAEALLKRSKSTTTTDDDGDDDEDDPARRKITTRKTTLFFTDADKEDGLDDGPQGSNDDDDADDDAALLLEMADLSPAARDFTYRLLRRSPAQRADVATIRNHPFLTVMTATRGPCAAPPNEETTPVAATMTTGPSSPRRDDGDGDGDDGKAAATTRLGGGGSSMPNSSTEATGRRRHDDDHDDGGGHALFSRAGGPPHLEDTKAGWRAAVFADWEVRVASRFDRRISTRRLGPFRADRRTQTIAIDAAGVATLDCRFGGGSPGGSPGVARLAVSGDGRRVTLGVAESSTSTAKLRVVFDGDVRRFPAKFAALYDHLARAVHLVRSRTPRVVVRYGRDGDVECALMENGPLPDVRVAWRDGATARYSLESSRFELKLPDGRHLSWCPVEEDEEKEELVGEDRNPGGGSAAGTTQRRRGPPPLLPPPRQAAARRRRRGAASWPSETPPFAYERLRTVQRGVALCLRAEAWKRASGGAKHRAQAATADRPPPTPTAKVEPRGKAPLAATGVRSLASTAPSTAPIYGSLSFVSDLTTSTHLIHAHQHHHHHHHHHAPETPHKKWTPLGKSSSRGVVPRVTPTFDAKAKFQQPEQQDTADDHPLQPRAILLAVHP